MGTNVDCYQRAEGRYQLMRGILAALRDYANPFSILTKGTLILRDLDLLTQAAEVTDVGLNVSVGFTDQALWRSLEPGTPGPERRLDVCATLTERGLPCGVLMGPVVPFLSDSPAHLEAAVRLIAGPAPRTSPRSSCTCGPGRGMVPGWLSRDHPALLPRYRALYGRGPTRRRITRRRSAGGSANSPGATGWARPRPGPVRRRRRGMGPIRRPAPGAQPAREVTAREAAKEAPMQLSLL